MYEVGTRRKPIPARWITRIVTVAVLALIATTGLGAAPAGAPAWRPDGPDGGSVPTPVFAPSDPSRVYLNAWTAVFRSDDGGASYEVLPTRLGENVLVSLVVDPADRDRLLAIGCDSSCRWVMRSLDAGRTWHPVFRDDATFPVIVRFGAGAAFLLTQKGLRRSDDGGATWIPSGLENPYIDGIWFDPRDPEMAIALTNYPVTLWRSADSGRSWAPMRTPQHWFAFRNLLFDPVRPGYLYAIANRHAVRSTDGGATWQTLLISREVSSAGVLGDGTLLLAPGGPGLDRVYGLVRSTDGGQSFTPSRDAGKLGPARPNDEINQITPGTDPHRAFASGSLGLWSTVDSGRSWQPVRGLAMHWVQTLRASAGGEPRVYAVTFSALFAREGDSGGWRKVHRGPQLAGAALPPRDFLGFEVDPLDSLHLIAFNNRELLDSRNGGRTWRSFSPAGITPGYIDFVTGMAVDWRTGAIYAAASESVSGSDDPLPRLAVTRDDGATWERLTPFARRRPSELFLSLAVDPRDPSVLWGSTGKAGIFRSGDQGHSWQHIGRGLPGIPERWQGLLRAAFAFDPGNPQRMIAAIPGRGIWQSTDGGQSFHRLGRGLEAAVVPALASAVDPLTGERFWLAGVRSQGIFRLDSDLWTAVGVFAEPDQFSGTFVFDPVDPAVLYAGTFGRSVLRLDLREQ